MLKEWAKDKEVRPRIDFFYALVLRGMRDVGHILL